MKAASLLNTSRQLDTVIKPQNHYCWSQPQEATLKLSHPSSPSDSHTLPFFTPCFQHPTPASPTAPSLPAPKYECKFSLCYKSNCLNLIERCETKHPNYGFQEGQQGCIALQINAHVFCLHPRVCLSPSTLDVQRHPAGSQRGGTYSEMDYEV